jgi:hypothetical protein
MNMPPRVMGGAVAAQLDVTLAALARMTSMLQPQVRRPSDVSGIPSEPTDVKGTAPAGLGGAGLTVVHLMGVGAVPAQGPQRLGPRQCVSILIVLSPYP